MINRDVWKSTRPGKATWPGVTRVVIGKVARNQRLLKLLTMRVLSRLLIVGLLSCLPTARGQEPGTVNVRPRVTTSTPGVPTVDVTVDRHRVPLGEEVTFTLSPASVVFDPNYIVTLDFGDKQKTQERKTKFVHVYRDPGNYKYSISVRSSGKNTTKVPDVFLFANPTAVTTNQAVSFNTQLSGDYPNLKYRFVFDDGSQTGWQEASYTKHEYGSAKTYLAYVDIGAPGARGPVERIGGSGRVKVQVTSSGQQQQLSVTLSAQPSRVEARQVVSFSAKVPSGDASLRYRFVFGEKSAATRWQVSPQASHRYRTAGAYSARVEVRTIKNIAGAQSFSSSPVLIEVRAATETSVSLTANPTSVTENLPVFFQARLSPSNSQVRYRFNFGDGSGATAWTERSFETHAYARAGDYKPFVEIGQPSTLAVRPIASSSTPVTVGRLFGNEDATPTPTATPLTSTPTPTPDTSSPSPGTPTPTVESSSPSPGTNSNTGGTTSASTDRPTPFQGPEGSSSLPWWIYLLIPLALYAGYRLWKWLTNPRPTFHPRLDPGVSEVGVDKPLSIDFQMQLNPNIVAGEYGIETNEKSIIKAERKSDD